MSQVDKASSSSTPAFIASLEASVVIATNIFLMFLTGFFAVVPALMVLIDFAIAFKELMSPFRLKISASIMKVTLILVQIN